MSEFWGTHRELPYHEISTKGNVRVKTRLSSTSMKLGTYLRGTTTVKGYKQVRVKNRNGQHKLYWVHRLVLETFVGFAPTKEHQTGHVNGVADDNRLENLRWVTPTENQAHRYLHGTDNAGSRNPMYKHGLYVGSK